MRAFLVLAALAACVPRASASVEVTCSDKAAAGITEACVVPFNFPAGTTVPVDAGAVVIPTAWQGAAPVCYTQYFQNQLATPTFMPRNSTCSAYAHRGCCSSETVRSIDNLDYLLNLYPGYSLYRCGPISAACTAFFQMEACFYECDHNMGKFRTYATSSCLDASGNQNGWQISNLPLQQQMVNDWWAACRNDLFCSGPTGSYFELPTLAANACVPPPAGSAAGTETATCKKFSTIYANATDMINRLWDGSFAVASSGGFIFPQPGATPYDNLTQATSNPNNVASALPDPPFCGFRPTVSGWIQAMNDFKLYVANMKTYAGATFSGVLYGSGNTLASASWWNIPPAAAPAAAACSAAAPALRAAAAAGVAAVAALVLA